jgi:PKD repeat protein
VAPSHVYASPGTYTVTLTVAGSDGLTAPISHTLTVVVAPVAIPSLATRTPVAGSPVAFNGGSSTGGISAYSWSFGDGAVGSGATPRHTYAKPGTYAVTLTVTDPEGFTSTRSLNVVVASPGKIKGWSVKRANGKYYLVVTVTQAGTIRVGSANATLKRPGKATFKLSLSHAERRALAQHKTVSLAEKIIYTPAVGPPIKRSARLKLKP